MATSDRQPTRQSTKCPECHAPARLDGVEWICVECGVVVATDEVDYGPDWRAHWEPGDDELAEHAKPGNYHHHDRGLGSEMGESTSRAETRQARQHHRAKTPRKKDRNRGYVTTEIQRIASALEVGDALAEQAKHVFVQAHERHDLLGYSLDTIAGAAVYAVCRIHQRGLTHADVAEHARADPRPIRRRFRTLMRELDLEAPPPDPRQRIRVVAREAGVSTQARERALKAVEALDDHAVGNGSPSTLAAALLYEASGSRITQDRVAEAAGCSANGLRKRRDGLKDSASEVVA